MPKSWDSIKPPATSWQRKPHPQFETPSARYARRILSGVMTETQRDPYQHKLRVSSLPICGLLDCIDRIEKPDRPRPYRMDFYTAQGTAIHETIQNRWVHSEKYGPMVFANWRCGETNCKHLLPAQMRPKSMECPRCGPGQLKYEELEFNVKGVSGHLDMLTQDKKGRWVAWEFKTTSEYNIQNPTKYLPQKKHHFQIQTYCLMLDRQFNIKVHSYVIVYINRNKTQDENKPDDAEQYLPFAFRFTPEMAKLREAQLERIRRSNLVIKRLLDKPDLVKLRKLESLRPCRSLADYNNPESGMAQAFFGQEQCPFKEKQLCFRDKDDGTEAGMRIARLLKIEEG